MNFIVLLPLAAKELSVQVKLADPSPVIGKESQLHPSVLSAIPVTVTPAGRVSVIVASCATAFWLFVTEIVYVNEPPIPTSVGVLLFAIFRFGVISVVVFDAERSELLFWSVSVVTLTLFTMLPVAFGVVAVTVNDVFDVFGSVFREQVNV